MDLKLNNINYSCIPMYNQNNKQVIAYSCSNKIMEHFEITDDEYAWPVWEPPYWSISTSYANNKLVLWNENLYVSTVTLPATTVPVGTKPDDSTKWKMLDYRFRFRPVWTADRVYRKDEQVFNEWTKKLYKAKKELNPSTQRPDQNVQNWQLYNLPGSIEKGKPPMHGEKTYQKGDLVWAPDNTEYTGTFIYELIVAKSTNENPSEFPKIWRNTGIPY
jgi:hypothetical protein